MMKLESFWQPEYEGAPFVLFGPGHLAAVALVVSIALSFVLLRRMPAPRLRRPVRVALALWLIGWVIAKYAWFFAHGQGSVRTMLPLHLCSISLWLSVIMLLTGNYRAYEFAFFLGLGGATQGLITPELGRYGLPHFRALHSFAAHGGIVLAALYMTLVEGYRPTVRSLGRVVFWMGPYAAAVFLLNFALGTNYLYLAAKPGFPTLIDLLAPWPWYVPQLALIALAVACLLYLPYWIVDSLRSAHP